MAERNDPKDPQPTQPIHDPRNPQPTQFPHDPSRNPNDPRTPQDPRIPNDPRLPSDPRNLQREHERPQADISRDAKPGTPASRDAYAARHAKIAGQQTEAEARAMEPAPEPLPIRAPAAHAIPLVSTTAAARPPEGPLMVTLYSMADPNVTMQCMPIDANDHIASGEWSAVHPAPPDPITRKNP